MEEIYTSIYLLHQAKKSKVIQMDDLDQKLDKESMVDNSSVKINMFMWPYGIFPQGSSSLTLITLN